MVAVMSGAGLLLRVVFSLGLVLLMVWLAARAVRNRGIAGASGSGTLRMFARPGSRSAGRVPAARQPFEVLGRTGLNRSVAIAAVRFGDKVHLIAASETASPALLASVDAADWQGDLPEVVTDPDGNVPGLETADPLEFLRTITARRRR